MKKNDNPSLNSAAGEGKNAFVRSVADKKYEYGFTTEIISLRKPWRQPL